MLVCAKKSQQCTETGAGAPNTVEMRTLQHEMCENCVEDGKTLKSGLSPEE